MDRRGDYYRDLWNYLWKRILSYLKCFWNKGLELFRGEHGPHSDVSVGTGGGGLSGVDPGHALSGVFAGDGGGLPDLQPCGKLYYDGGIQYFYICIAVSSVSEWGEGFEICTAQSFAFGKYILMMLGAKCCSI